MTVTQQQKTALNELSQDLQQFSQQIQSKFYNLQQQLDPQANVISKSYDSDQSSSVRAQHSQGARSGSSLSGSSVEQLSQIGNALQEDIMQIVSWCQQQSNS